MIIKLYDNYSEFLSPHPNKKKPQNISNKWNKTKCANNTIIWLKKIRKPILSMKC